MKSIKSNSNVRNNPEASEQTGITKKTKYQLHRLNIPGFIADEDIGLGDVIEGVTYAMGIKPCGGCQRRAAALNQRIVFSPRGKK